MKTLISGEREIITVWHKFEMLFMAEGNPRFRTCIVYKE